ncbi:nucleotidyltransferase family protein [Ramlibacter sp. USB13]|uniref:Nucleotidyltransferase family protein n=1 Tax=Ramlibacter cellulosilyticus TaxID=2764187 RepID=A0A923MTH8_9BURK|nr:nucleotidyltransferase family protein [Ramlibacter cellulosilyticus]MBC5783517.1 nucleotidyltransferase family protein [Ramlibacter cellulosilyticus]
MNDPAFRFSAVVLAAGSSSRMGGPNKLLLPVQGEPLVRRTVRTVLAAGVQEAVVVTGHQAREVMRVLADLPVTLQPNLRHEDGQMRSVAAGVAALARATDAILVCPGDLPLLTAADVAELMDAYAAHADHSIVIPRHGGQRGNPIVFAAAYAPEVAAGRRLVGCRKLAAQYPEETWYHDAVHDRFTTDLDTPADYERVLQRLAEPVEA